MRVAGRHLAPSQDLESEKTGGILDDLLRVKPPRMGAMVRVASGRPCQSFRNGKGTKKSVNNYFPMGARVKRRCSENWGYLSHRLRASGDRQEDEPDAVLAVLESGWGGDHCMRLADHALGATEQKQQNYAC